MFKQQIKEKILSDIQQHGVKVYITLLGEVLQELPDDETFTTWKHPFAGCHDLGILLQNYPWIRWTND
jgi:hypothetical protein